jgi:hypothetical protein
MSQLSPARCGSLSIRASSAHETSRKASLAQLCLAREPARLACELSIPGETTRDITDDKSKQIEEKRSSHYAASPEADLRSLELSLAARLAQLCHC